MTQWVIQLRAFSELHVTLLNYADQFPVYANCMDVKKMVYTFQELEKIVTKFETEYAHLSLHPAITAAVQLGAACLCGNPEAIVIAIEVLNRPWK